MGTVPQNMSQTPHNPGATTLLSTLLPSVMLLAKTSNSVTGTGTEHWTGIMANTETDREKFDSLKKSSEEIEMLRSVGYKDWHGTDLTTCQQSSETRDEKNVNQSFLAYSILFCFLLFPSLLENKKYENSIDCHESCHLQTSPMSTTTTTDKTFEI